MATVTASDLKIDKNRLDAMVMEQPTLYYQASEEFSNLVSMRDWAKEKLSRVKAEVASKIRKGEGKTTENMVSEEILKNPDYQAACDYHLDLCTKTEKAQSLRDAFHQRAYVLRDLVQLYSTGYFMSSAQSGRPAPTEGEVRKREETMARIKRRRENIDE